MNSYFGHTKVNITGTDPVVTTLRLRMYHLLYAYVRMYVHLKLNETNMDPSPSNYLFKKMKKKNHFKIPKCFFSCYSVPLRKIYFLRNFPRLAVYITSIVYAYTPPF